jgi:hypothetical protein
MGHGFRVVALVAIALLVLADSGAAQRGGQRQGRGPGRDGGGPALLRDSLPGRGPIELLLAGRDSLGLTRSQLTQLERINAELQEQNAPHVRSMLELRRELQPLIGMHPRDMSPAQRAQFQKQAGRARPIMQQMHESNRRAMERVSELLTSEQKRRVREWLEGSRVAGAALPEF